MPPLSIVDLRGGINNSDSPTLLADTEVVDARNVDSRAGALGSKRRGTQGIPLDGSAFDSPVIAIIRHQPTNDVSDDELWGIDLNGNLDRRVGGSWQGGVARVNTKLRIRSNNYDANGVSLHGKLFLAARGDHDRLFVWDGSVLRWAGLAAPPPPTVTDAGTGTYSGTRYFRIRYVEKTSAGVTLRRSEPSTVVVFTPSGSGSGATITKPSGTEDPTSEQMEGQTHWEVEASVDNILFYRIAAVEIGTPTYTDETAFDTGYTFGTLSEQIGEYSVPGAARHVAVDEDRLVLAGSYFEEALDATVWWTPVAADDGVGNDERIPTATRQFISFDGRDGGAVTALVSGVAGNVYVFKTSRTYKMVRTGIVEAAYDPVTESFSRGCLPRAACSGTDQQGVPCAYFLDPAVGLCRIGRLGIEALGRPIRNTWRGRNVDAAISPRIIYYPELEQVWYTSPTFDPQALQTSESTNVQTADGSFIFAAQTRPGLLVNFEARYGGSWFHDELLGAAVALGLFPTEEGVRPVIGTHNVEIEGGGTSSLHFADTGTTDSGTPYRSYVKTKPYLVGDLWQKFGVMASVVMAKASAGASLLVKLIRNFGEEERETTADLSPVGAEPHVIKTIDNAYLSSVHSLQIEYGDDEPVDQAWELDRMVFNLRKEEGSA